MGEGSPQSRCLGAASPGAPSAACRAPGLSPEDARATHVHVVHVLVPLPPLLHVGAQGRDGRGALFEGCEGGRPHAGQARRIPATRCELTLT